jgi:hypothetical protein
VDRSDTEPAVVDITGEHQHVVRGPVRARENLPQHPAQASVIIGEVRQGMVLPIAVTLEDGLSDHEDRRPVETGGPGLEGRPLLIAEEEMRILAHRGAAGPAVAHEERDGGDAGTNLNKPGTNTKTRRRS